MSTTRYLIAKHVPDVFRNEPKNIGVVVLSEVGTVGKFWGADRHGNVDSRKVPDWVASKPAYRQWVTFWLSEIQKPEVEVIGRGETVQFVSPRIVEALQSANKDTFFLGDPGEILEPVTRDDLPKLLDQLFTSLVGTENEIVGEPDTSELVKQECEKIIKQTPLANNHNFRKGMVVQCQLSENVVEPMEFSYSLMNGGVKWLGHQVPLHRYRGALSESVDSVAWRFSQVVRTGVIPKERGATFIYPTPEQLRDKDVKKKIDVLREVSTVLDLREPNKVKQQLEEIAALH